MATTTPLQAVPIPVTGDADNVPADFATSFGYVEGRLVMRFASAASRDSTVTSPAEGMTAWLQDVNQLTVYTGSAWVLSYMAPNSTGAWASWTPTWAASTTQPVVGNGSLTGRYTQIGKTVFASLGVVFGSTTTAGTGNWLFSVPVAPNTTVIGASGIIGTAEALDFGTGQYLGMCRMSAANFVIVVPTLASFFGNTIPFTWVSGDTLSVSLTYEAA